MHTHIHIHTHTHTHTHSHANIYVEESIRIRLYILMQYVVEDSCCRFWLPDGAADVAVVVAVVGSVAVVNLESNM